MSRYVAGVVGAGVIGRGVAQSLAMAGHRVVLVDVSDDVLERSVAQMRRDLRLARVLGRLAPGAEGGALENIETTTDYDRLSVAEVVVENVTEDPAVKERVYRRLNDVCGPDVLFAVNTSAIPVTSIAAQVQRPERVIGIHFMNPVPLKDTVEVIRGFHTSPATVLASQELLRSMGKKWVMVEDSPGFVSNRVLMLAVNEAAFLVHEGIAPAESVDEIFKSCFGHKMGMLETADLIGIDTVLRSIKVLQEQFGDSKYRPCPLLKQMVDAGMLGRKTGRGFYTYEVA